MNRLIHSITALLLATGGFAPAASLVEAVMNTRFVLRGEPASLDLVMRSETAATQLDGMPVIPPVRNLSIRADGRGVKARQTEGRRLEVYLPYTVQTYDAGNYVIPSIEVSIAGEIHRTSPVELRVIDEMTLAWSQAVVGGQRIRYSAAFHAIKDKPYIGEKQPVELKLYFPAEQFVVDWGIPDFDRDGLSAWRFQPQTQQRVKQINMLGRPYFAVAYPSTVSTNRPGKATLGPAALRLQVQYSSAQNFGRAVYEEANLKIPAIDFDSRPLPDDPPEGFENAIGTFELAVTAGETEVRQGDPVTMQIRVSGSGNLDALNPPKPINSDGWKLYDASADERGDERREISGEVVFRQFLRPLLLQRSIPPFRLVYFDPAKESYETLLSDAIPLSVLPSTAAGATTGPPQSLPMPLEEMTDILGVVTPSSGLLASRKTLPEWTWHLLPALLALGLLIRIAILKVGPRLRKDPDVVARAREWREVERAPDQTGAFYRSVGHFIERWLGDRRDPQIAEVLAKRDQVCFRQETADARIDRAERQRVLKQIRNLALPLVAFFFAVAGPSSDAAEEPGALFNDARYSEAAKAWLDSGPYERLSADTLYNIGNAAYRMGSPGEAALYYRRALQRDSAHPEARQNLRFLERKFGSITLQRPDYQHLLARRSVGFWKDIIWGSAWVLVLGLLVFPATRPGAGARIAAIAGFVTAPLVAIGGFLALRYYPDEARFAPAKEQAVIIADSAAIRTDAARTAPKVIDAPAGSLCRLVTRSGEWAYVAFTNDSRGWVPLVDIRPLLPETTPEPPTPRPSKGSESDA